VAQPDLSAESIGRLAPADVVALLEHLDPADPRLAGLDLNALARAVDPRKLSKDEFVRLVGALDALGRADSPVDLAAFDADSFARLITRASAGQVTALMAAPGPRALVLGEVFRRMGEHYRPDRAAAGTRAVVHWRLTGGAAADGYDRFETVIENGACTVSPDRTRDPRVTITIGPAEFLKLITRNASAPVLFMTGKLRIRGDLAFAATLPTLFDLPTPT
jgi:hypothetical protein